MLTLYRLADGQKAAHGVTHPMRVRIDGTEQLIVDAVIDKFRTERRFENLRLF